MTEILLTLGRSYVLTAFDTHDKAGVIDHIELRLYQTKDRFECRVKPGNEFVLEDQAPDEIVVFIAQPTPDFSTAFQSHLQRLSIGGRESSEDRIEAL